MHPHAHAFDRAMVWRTFLVPQDPATALLSFRSDCREIVAAVKLTPRRISTVVVREEAHREKQGKEQEPLLNIMKV